MSRTNNCVCVVCGKPFYKRPNNDIVCCSMECSVINRPITFIKNVEEKNNIEDLGKWLIENYQNNKLSYREISQKLSINNRTVKKLLTHYSIKIRYGSESIKSQWYGDKRKNRVHLNVYNNKGDYAEILMHGNDGNVTGVALIDVEDIEAAKKYHWCLNSKGYAVTTVSEPKPRRLLLHRHLLSIDSDKFADHINGDRLDNRKSNLRTCTAQQNTLNRCIPKTNTSGTKGVSKTKYGKWQASITYSGRQMYLGTFDEIDDAIKARKEAEAYYFKEFMRV